MSSNMNMPPNLEGLATLLVLQDQLKNISTLKEFGYFVTNETHRLLYYNTAYLWKKGEIVKIQLLDQSEIAEIDMQSPFSQWIQELISEMLKLENPTKVKPLNFTKNDTDPEAGPYTNIDEETQLHWPENFPRYVLWDPFVDLSDEITGGLILFRETSFSEQEIKMFLWLAKNYQYTWLVLTRTKFTSFQKWIRTKPYLKILSLIFLLCMIFPIRMSVTSSATVESSTPSPINSPIPGIIQEFLVKPGDTVKAGQLLMIIDKRDYIKSIAVNQKKVLLTQAKLRSANNQGYDKPEIRDQIPILEAELAVDQSELDYTQSLLAKTDITSPIDGIAIFDSKEDWVGQPVQPGETIMTIEDPKQVQLKIVLPVPDIIDIDVGAKGNFYVYGQLSEFPVVLTSFSYNAKMTPNKVLAYEFIAKFVNPSTAPRIGSQGSARLYGNYVPVVYFLLRRPLQALRQTFGF